MIKQPTPENARPTEESEKKPQNTKSKGALHTEGKKKALTSIRTRLLLTSNQATIAQLAPLSPPRPTVIMAPETKVREPKDIIILYSWGALLRGQTFAGLARQLPPHSHPRPAYDISTSSSSSSDSTICIWVLLLMLSLRVP